MKDNYRKLPGDIFSIRMYLLRTSVSINLSDGKNCDAHGEENDAEKYKRSINKL